MASPMMARLLPACPRSPRKLPAPNGTVRGSLGCGQRPIGRAPMASELKPLRCAIYTRKSTEHGLELEFNSLDAQRDACEAYIKSQASQGWRALPQHYDDPAFSGGNLDRPALQQLLKDIDASRIDVIVVYKIDRLTRSLADFAKLVEAFDAKCIVTKRRDTKVRKYNGGIPFTYGPLAHFLKNRLYIGETGHK